MRRPDWPERLAQALRKADTRTFSETDYCVLFAADCVQAMTGVDYADEYRGLSIDDARQYLKEQGGTVYSNLVKRFGKPVPLSFAQRGDLVIRTKPDMAMGICCGSRSAFLSSHVGIVYVPTLDLRWAFSVS